MSTTNQCIVTIGAVAEGGTDISAFKTNAVPFSLTKPIPLTYGQTYEGNDRVDQEATEMHVGLVQYKGTPEEVLAQVINHFKWLLEECVRNQSNPS